MDVIWHTFFAITTVTDTVFVVIVDSSSHKIWLWSKEIGYRRESNNNKIAFASNSIFLYVNKLRICGITFTFWHGKLLFSFVYSLFFLHRKRLRCLASYEHERSLMRIYANIFKQSKDIVRRIEIKINFLCQKKYW